MGLVVGLHPNPDELFPTALPLNCIINCGRMMYIDGMSQVLLLMVDTHH